MGDRPIARLLPAQDSITQRNADTCQVSGGIRGHDPRVQAVQDYTQL
jgi:hypothetical protein